VDWRRALVEREVEVAAIGAALKRATSDGQVVLIKGPAGIGKTRLLDVLRQEAGGFDVMAARGGVLERDVAFGVVRQLLEPRLARAAPPDRDALLAAAAAPAADVLGLAGSDPGLVPSQLSRSLHALFWLVVNLAERQPVVLAIDDGQWADAASLEFLAYLGRRLEGLPVLIAMTVRDGEPWSHELAGSEIDTHATVVRPAPLTPDGVGQLVDLAFGAPSPRALVEACLTATGGNPFYLRELLVEVGRTGSDPADLPIETVRATVPETVARSILLRLGRLGDPAVRLASAAALLEDGASLRHAAALAELAVPSVEDAADALVRASILSDVAPIRFNHPIVLAAIAGEMPPARRGAAHRRAALILHAEGARVERIVPHLLRATPAGDQWVVAMLRRAAGIAAARGALDAAVTCLRRALEEPPAEDLAGLLADLSRMELASGAYAASAATAARAIDAAAGPAGRAVIRLPQSTALLAVEGAAAALTCLEQGIDEATGVDPELALLLEAELACQSWFTDMPHGVVDRIARHRDLPGHTAGQRSVLAVLAFEALRRHEPAGLCRELALRALAAGRMLAEQSAQTMVYFAATSALLAAEAHDDARDAVAAGMADCRARGMVYGVAGIFWMRGLLALAEGDLTGAEADERTCVEHAVPTMVGIGVASLALVLLEKGDVAGAADELARGGLLTDARPLYVWGPYVRGLVRLAQGRPADALADFRDVGRHATEVGGFPAALPWRAHAALALAALGDTEDAREMADAELARARRLGTPRALGVALRASGLVAAGEERLVALAAAVEVLETTPARLDLARARYDLGLALLRAGRRREGREVLERAYDGARACGARGLTQAAYDELLVAGSRPRRLTFTGVESLTASERRVAQMAAEGMSNRDIAQALFVTPKTVENQLGRVYVKLGVSSRRALSGVLETS
jgi:DNA-binding CsgD family transcriptional regulator